MKKQHQNNFFLISSRYYSAAFHKRKPFIGFLSVESGGRKRSHLDHNLLKPGYGISLCSGSIIRRCTAAIKNKQITYNIKSAGFSGKITVKFTDKNLNFKFIASTPLKKIPLLPAFSPKAAPPALLGRLYNYRDQDIDPFPVHGRLMPAGICLPGWILFPDYGMVKLQSPQPGIFIRQQAFQDKGERGLNLGLTNQHYHTTLKAFHHGYLRFHFFSPRPRQHFELNLGIVPEHYPSIIKKQTKAARWNGFKRTWMNAFQPNCQNHEIGDNIYMPGRTHLAMVFKSDMAVFTPDLAPGISVRNVIRNNITRCYSYNLGRDGKLFSLRRQNGKIIRKYINYNDCDPAMLIAFSNHLRATNDWGWALPLLKQTARACRYLLSQDKDNDGILESAFHGNHMDDQRPSINWWDDFAFGHKDAYYNLLAYRALKEMMSVYNLCGRQQLAAEIKKILAEFKKNFSRIFYNPASGVYCGWVSRDGRQHDYMFSFITAMAAIQEVIPRRTARRALNILYQKMRKQGYDFKYGVPGPCIPVDKQDTWVWEPMSAWGRYENGGLCGHTAYYFIQALYQYGMRQKADRILFAMLETFEKEPTHSGVHPGYTKSCDWRTKEGQSCGYNYLADNYYFLLAVITGYCGIKMPPVKAPPAHLVEKMK